MPSTHYTVAGLLKRYKDPLQLSDIPLHTLKQCLESEKMSSDRLFMMLIEHDDQGNTVLHYSAQRGHVETMQCLVNHMAEPQRATSLGDKNNDDTTPFHYACVAGREEWVKCALELIPSDQRYVLLKTTDKDGVTPLHLAAGRGHADIVKCMILSLRTFYRFLLVSMQDKSGSTALHWSAIEEHKGTCERLINFLTPTERLKMLTEVRTNAGKTPEELAKQYNKEEMAGFLDDLKGIAIKGEIIH